MAPKFKPNFSFTLPKNGNYDSALRVANEYGFICRIYDDLGEKKVGLWEKCRFLDDED